MVNKSSIAKLFKTLELDDKDLIMFTITNLNLEKRSQQVHMVLTLKRKVQTEMLTTYLPTMLLLAITYATTFFKPIYFEASLSVNLTIMLVMTTIFTSKIEELPSTSDTKLIDIWLIGCLLVPFTEKRRDKKKVHKAKKKHRRKAWADDKPTSGMISPQVTQVKVSVNGA